MVRRQPRCNGCQQRGVLNYPLWSIPNSSGLHVDLLDNKPLCADCCIIKAKDDDKKERGDFIGYLSEKEKDEYIKNVVAEEHNNLLEEGVTVIDGESLKQGPSEIYLSLEFYNMLKEADLAPLRENVDDITKQSTNDYRVWCNLHSEEESRWNNTTSKMNNLCTPLLTELGARLMPHRHFAKLAHRRYNLHINNTMEFLLDGDNIRQQAILQHQQQNTDAVLCLEKVNVLVRGPPLKSRQGPHIDGKSYKLIVLLVDYTDESGYEFLYLPRSHNINDLGRFLKTELPEKLMKSLRVKKGDLIVFFENTIHSGGKASEANDDALGTTSHSDYNAGRRIKIEELMNRFVWFRHDEEMFPSDISFQLSLRYGYLSDPGNNPNRSNLWFKNVTSDEDKENVKPEKETPIEMEIRTSMDNGKRELSEMDIDFMRRLVKAPGWRKSRRNLK